MKFDWINKNKDNRENNEYLISNLKNDKKKKKEK